MVSRLHLGLLALIFMFALSTFGTTVPVSHAATATSFTFAVGGDHGDSLITGAGATSLSMLKTVSPDFYLAIGDLSYTNTTTGNTWCSQFKSSYNNVEVLAGNHDTGEENGTAATRSYERYVTGCPYTFLPSVSPPLNCGPVLANCYGKEYYFDFPSINPIARFIMISPVVFNVTGVCTVATRCNSAFASPCDDLHGCWAYNKADVHYNWVSNTIDNARTSSTIKWVVVGMHKVCISAGDQSCNIGPDLLNLMISKNVDLVLEGHDHSYQRSKQLALNGSTCTGITTASSFPVYNSNCVVNDGSAGVYTPGAGTVIVIQGTFGAGYNTVNDTTVNGGASAKEAPYFAKLMGKNTPGNGHGFMQYTITSDRIDAKSSFSGSYQDSFTIGKAFVLSSSPSFLVFQAGSSGSSTITIASQGGFTGTVSLSLSQTGCSCTISSISPTSVDLTNTSPTASATLQVSGAFAGNVTLMATGTSGAISFSTQVAVSVQDFSISTTKPSLTLNFNASDTSPINLASLNNFAGTVSLAPTVSPSGLTFSLSPLSIPITSKGSGSATLSVTGSAPGNYTVTVGAASGPTSHAIVVKVRVLGDFTLSSTKTALTLSPGSIDSSIIITLVGSGKYSGAVNLAVAVTPGAPSGPTASLALTSLKLKATTTSDGTNSTILTVNAGMVAGTYTINVTATSGLLFHSTILSLTVTQAHPAISTTLSSSTILAGGSASDSAALTGATTTAGGTVTYSVFFGTVCSGTPVFVQTVSVTNGVVPGSRAVRFNATGSFEWQATYSGDVNNALPPPTSCGSELLTVNVTATTVTTTLSSTSIVPGGVVSDSATLTGFFGGFSTGGTATYSVYPGTVCTVTPIFTQTVNVNSVNGAIPTSSNVLFNTPGTYQWQVAYSGDANNGASTSVCGTESLSVGQATPSVATTLSTSSVVVGNSVSDTATITGGATPTGTVTFNVYSSTACSGTTVATKTVPLASGFAGPVSVIFNNTGIFNWQAVYNGDASNKQVSSTCGTETLTVTKALPAVAESVSATTIVVGNSVNANATVSGGFSPTGTVTFSVFTGSTCSGTTVANKIIALASGTAGPFSVVFNSTGTFNWQATYNGDANNNPISACKSLVVNKITPIITTSLSSPSIQVGGSVSASASMTNSFQAGGTITYSYYSGSTCGGTQTVVGSPVTVSNGIVPNSASQTFSTAQPYSWNALYSGDTNNNPATGSCALLTVNPKGVSIATSLSPATITVGGSVFDSATITMATSTAGGTVTYNLFTSGTCSGSPSIVSIVTVTNMVVPNSRPVTFNSTAPVSWNATYSGDPNNARASSPCEPLTVNKTNPSITSSVSPSPIIVGQSTIESASLTSSFQAGGSVNYLQFSTGTCSGSPTTVSTVTVTNNVIPSSSPINPVPSGTYGFEASYTGDANNNPMISSCASLAVNKASPTIIATLSQNTIPVGSSVSDSASMTGGYQTGGTVTYAFFTGGSCTGTSTTVGSPVTVTNGVVPSSAAKTFNAAGPYSWNAAYSGDANNNPATSPCEPLTVNKTTPTIATVLSQNPIVASTSVTDSAALTNSFQAGGTVTYSFFSGSTCSGPATIVGTPVAVSNSIVPNSASQPFNTAGPYSWNAAYSGDTNNNVATSACEPLTVNPKIVSVNTSLSLTTITVGGSVADSATMTGATSTAGGTVTYNLFTSGTCSGSPSPVSTVTVTNAAVPNSKLVTFNNTAPVSWNAIYSGDPSNSGATSPCEPLTVNKTNPTISTSLSSNLITVGQSVTESATLMGSFQAGGSVNYLQFATGTCSGSSTQVSTVTVTNGIIPSSSQITPVPSGTYGFEASYSGDSNNNPITSTCASLTVNKSSPTITTSLSLTNIPVGSSVSDSATMTAGYQPGGTVTYVFFTGGSCTGTSTTVGSPVTVTNGVVPSSSAQGFSNAGSYSWNAAYNGDANNNPITSPCEPITVSKVTPTISTTLSANPITVGGSVSDSATMTGGFQAGGTVTYNWFTGGICSGTASLVSIVNVVNGGIPSSTSQTFNSAGPYSWNAVYSGDANNNGSPSGCELLTVSRTSVIAISTALSSSSITVGGSVADSATLGGVTSGAGGTVTYSFFSGSTCSGTATVVGSPVAVSNGIVPNSSPQTFNKAGPYSWNALYSGDVNNGGAASACEPLVVNQAAPSITTTVSSNNVLVGTPVHDSATLSNAFNAGGSVTFTLFSDAGCTVSSIVLPAVTVTNGVVPDSSATSPTPSGAYSFQASYGGDANNKSVTGACEPFNVLKASPGITTSLSLTTIPVGSSVSDSATMTGGYQPGGSVTYVFFTGSSCPGASTTVGSPVAVTNGVVPGSSSQPFNSAGAYGWSAVYSGDANNNPVTSSCEPLTVSKASPAISTTLSANPITVGGSVYDSATMTGAFQGGGSATYFAFTTADCTGSATTVTTVTVNLGAVPSSSPQPFSSAGSFSWNLRYFGDSNNNPTTSPCEPLTVSKASPTISTNLSVNPVTVGGSVSDFATMTAGFQAGGSATYFLFSTADCTGLKNQVSVVSVSNGVIPSSISQPFNTAGPYSWNLGYSGDTNNNASTAPCEPLLVNKANPAVSTSLSPNNIIVVGNPVSDSATIANSFQSGGTVTYSFFIGSTCGGTATVVGTPVTVTNGVVPTSSPHTFDTAGAFSWNAAYSGDVNNNPATSACEPLTVNPKGVAIATSLSSGTITVGGSVFDSAVLTGATSNAGGTVTYNLFSSGICSGSPSSISKVTVTSSTIPNSRSVIFNNTSPVGWNAVYSGDVSNSPATSLCEPLTVNKATPMLATTVSATSATIGSAFHDSATLTGAFNAGGIVSYSMFNNNACSGSSTPVGSPAVVTGGVVPDSGSITPSSAGPYSFQASYSGDANNNGASSPCEPFVVNKISPTVTTTLSANSIVVGGSASDSTTITGGFNLGGTVTYSYFQNSNCAAPGTTVGSPVTMTNGVVPNSSSQTFSSAGPYSWNAVYNGDANNNAVASACEPFTVNKVGPSISTALSQNPITVGGSVFDSAAIIGGFQAGGSVTYNWFTGGTCSGALTILPSVTVVNGVVQNSISQKFDSAGPYSWNALYSGDTNNNVATSNCEPLTVNPTSGATISTSLSPSIITVGGSVTDSATLTGVTPGAGGTVTYNSFQIASCTGTLAFVSTVTVVNGIVPGSASKTFNTAGSFSWNAVYNGDANNVGGATSACEPLIVNQANPGITTTLSATNVPVGNAVHDSASLSNAFNAGGTVTYTLFSNLVCAGSGTAFSTVSVSNNVIPDSSGTSPAPAGGYSFQASYGGDPNNKAATSACEQFAVLKVTPTITSNLLPSTVAVGSSVSDTATMTGAFQAGGTVTYTLYTGNSCSGIPTPVSTVTVVNSVIPSSSPATPDSIGSFSWRVAYNGDVNNNPASSNCAGLVVIKTSPTIATSLQYLTISVGDSVYDSATLAGSFRAGGTVTYSFYSGLTCSGSGTVVGSPVVVANGITPNSGSQSFTLAGLYSWTAAYSGDVDNNLATSPCEPLNVIQAVSSLALPQVGSITVGNSIIFSATLVGTTSNAGGTVTYNIYAGGNCQGTAIPISTVQVTNRAIPQSRSWQFTSTGTFGWNAVYSGDPNNAHATSSCGPIPVSKATPTVSLTLSASVISKGSVLSGSATLTGGFAAGGTVAYNQFSSVDCKGTPAVVANVTVSNNVVPSSSSQTFATDGKFGWNAIYSGDSNNNPGIGPCRVLTVTAPPLLSVPGDSQLVNSGSKITFTVTATDPSWNNITLTASGLPTGASFPGVQSLTGSATSTFSWTPSDAQGSADHKVTFTVDDGHGGKTISVVTIHVTKINRSSPLNNAIPFFVVALVAGTAVVLAAPFLLRRLRK